MSSDSEDFDPRMFERTDAKDCIIYPENGVKETWDSFVSIALLVTCVITPMQLSFDLSAPGMVYFNNLIDGVFGLDIILTFISAT